MEFIMSFLSAFVSEYRIWTLASRTEMYVNGRRVSKKELRQSYRKGDEQARQRQGFGLLSSNGKCVCQVDERGHWVVKDA